MAQRLHIIASCTDRKRWAAPRDLQLRHTPNSEAETRSARWWDKLSLSSALLRPAMDLYSGGHWSVVQELLPIASAAGFKVELWVVSAGYGLVPSSSLLRPYSATFTSGLPDSVCPANLLAAERSRYLGRWWRSLSKKRGPQPGSVRCVRDLARGFRDSTILVIASGSYVAALEEDLLLACEALRDGDRLIVVSGESPLFPRSILSNRVTVDARLQPRLGGALSTLGARLARDVLRKAGRTGLSAKQLQLKYHAISKRQKPVPLRTGQPMSDEDVCKYIDRSLMSNPDSRHTRLLRALRESGRSCEANRFRRLFLERTST